MTERPGRARPLSRDERRTAILQATIPLLTEHGTAVTTRQIAQAAGVAEGTLFRVFADKEEILRTAVREILDPAPLAAELRAVPTDCPLADTVAVLVETLAERQRAAMRVWGAAHQFMKERPAQEGSAQEGGTHVPPPSHREIRSRSMQELLDVIAEVLVTHCDELRLDPRQAARILFSIVMGNSMPIVGDDGCLEIPEIVDVVLHGIGRPSPVGAGPPH